MAMPGQEVVDRAERAIGELVQDTNESAAATRTAWVFWMALLGFFVIALAGVSHKDLLLETPVELPLLQVKIPQASFFLFGPLVLVLMHLNLLMQHVTLSRKLKDVDDRLTRHEGHHLPRQHRLRSVIHSYPMAQAVAGPWRSPVYGFFLHAVTWTTLILLPLLVLINFQATYLPQHDAATTGWHRVYIAADALLIVLLGTLILVPDRGFRGALASGASRYPLSVIGSGITAVLAVLFSLLVATIPDETLDTIAAAIWPARIERPTATGPESQVTPDNQRVAFWPTVMLFDGPVDPIAMRPSSPMSRNFVVISTPLVTPVNPEPDDASLSLRGRNLRYATFDRSDLRRVDMTGADLTGASLVGTGLIKARLTNARLAGADLRGAAIISTLVRGASFENAKLCTEQRFAFQGQDEPKGLLRVACPR